MTASERTLKQKKVIALLVLLAAACMLTAGSACANSYGINITKNDGISPGGVGVGLEDNEVEPGMAPGQHWDLEGFRLNGNKLSIIGGYNFYTGQGAVMPGDIFIDTNGDAIYSPGTIPGFDYGKPYQQVMNGLFNYDYVLDVDWKAGIFDIIQLNQNSILMDTMYGAKYNTPSNPWRYLSGGERINSSALFFNNYNQASQIDTGFIGWNGNNNHFVATFDISKIDLSNGAVFHNTMECGNDNLIGHVSSVSEPSTLLLMGAGLVGVGLASRKKQHGR